MTSVSPAIALDGAHYQRRNLTQRRIRGAGLALFVVFVVVAGRLVLFGLTPNDTTIEGQTRDLTTASRPPILDRHGLELAVDIRVPSLYAEPRRILDVDEAVAGIVEALPDINADWLRAQLRTDKGFVWVRRELSPATEDKIMRLGIPGLDFLTESQRFYPGGSEAAHLLGVVNVDHQGIAGIEQDMDGAGGVALLQSVGLARGADLTPVRLSIDLRVQHAMHDVLTDALVRYRAVAAAGVMMDVKTGEVLGLVSLPDFDPNEPTTALEEGRFNRVTAGIFELGSTFKTVTMAAALDSGKVRITDRFDARFGVQFGRFTIDDFHGKHRILSVPEIYKYSSNIGTIKTMQQMGAAEFRAFLTKIGFDTPVPLELPERRRPSVPAKFSEIAAATASFGHGLSITPLHMARAIAAFVNDGNMVAPTLYPRDEAAARATYERVISPQTSEKIRYLMRLNALEGSGTRMNNLATGYRAGGKTGTAEKVVKGRYDSSVTMAVFASAFPLDAPRYALVVLVDEPKKETPQSGTTAGWNAGEVTGRIVQRVAPMLGISPDFNETLDQDLVPSELR